MGWVLPFLWRLVGAAYILWLSGWEKLIHKAHKALKTIHECSSLSALPRILPYDCSYWNMLNSAVGVLTSSPFSPTWRRNMLAREEGEKVRRRRINNNIDTWCVQENLHAAVQIPIPLNASKADLVSGSGYFFSNSEPPSIPPRRPPC